MKRFQGKASAETVARFLVLDPLFPRSVSHCLHAAGARLERVRTPGAGAGGQSLARLLALEAALVREGPVAIDEGTLHALLTRVVDETHAICDEIGRELLGAPPPAPADVDAQ